MRGRPRLPVKGSVRIAKRRLTALELPLHKKSIMQRHLNQGKVWNAVRQTYSHYDPRYTRSLVAPAFKPRWRSQANNTFLRNKHANYSIRKANKTEQLTNIVLPIHGNGNRGGVNSGYVMRVLRNNPIKYAIVGSNGMLKGFALLKNIRVNHSRYIDVIAGPGVGHTLMNKIISNAKANKKSRINLKAVISQNILNKINRGNATVNNNKLVQWYKGKGYKVRGALNFYNGLQPMSLNLP
jgi:hypothetical protein